MDFSPISGRDFPRFAAIKTFFVGQCLIQFIDVAQAWVRHELPIFERDVELHGARVERGAARGAESQEPAIATGPARV